MRGSLEIVGGPQTGERADVGEGHALMVGRGAPARLQIPTDASMSKVHFTVECMGAEFRLRDLKTEKGTFVNAQPVSEAVLQDGDRIVAGETTFVVRFDTGDGQAAGKEAPAQQSPPPGTSSARAPAGPAAAAMTHGGSRVARAPARTDSAAGYTEETCPSGLSVFRSVGGKLAPARMAELLAKRIPLHALIDLNMLEEEVPADLDSPCYFMDWIPESVVSQVSPILVSPDETGHFYRLVEEAWGADAVVCLYTPESKSTLLQHLRHCARHRFPKAEDEQKEEAEEEAPAADADQPDEGMIALYRSRVMSALLANGPGGFVEQFCSGIEAVLLETDARGGWQIYAQKAFAQNLTDAGLAPIKTEKSPDA